MNIFVVISGAFILLLGLGFLIGFFRGWCKSLIRLGILVGLFLLVFFVVPLISNLVVGNIEMGTEFNVLGISFDISDILVDYIGSDLDKVAGTTTALLTTIVNVALNLILFIGIFLVLDILSYIIYLIVTLIIKFAGREDRQEVAVKSENNAGENANDSQTTQTVAISTATTHKQNIWLKILGGFEGLLGSVILCLIILTPVFGVMNVLDKTIEDTPVAENVAGAISGSNFICGDLYYTEDENVGEIESVIEEYAILKEKYNSSLIGFTLKYTGINSLGKVLFNRLATVKVDDKEVNFTDECSVIIETYSIYKESFLKDEFNIVESDSIQNIENLYSKATESIFVKSYVEDLVPTIAQKWSDNETFVNIENPIPEEYRVVGNDLLKVFASARSFNNIDNNLRTILKIAKNAHSQGIIQSVVNGEDIMSLLSNNNTIVKDVIVELSSTYEFRNNLPNALNNALVVIYNIIVGDGKFTYTPADTQETISDYNSEAEQIQNIVNEILSIYNNLDSFKGDSVDSIISELGSFGRAIDASRKSKILSNSLKEFIINFISSDKINFGESSDSIKETLIGYINDKWDINENPDFSFETTFKAIGETAKVANDVLKNIENVTIDDLSNVLQSVVANNDVKEILADVIKEEVIKEFVGESPEAEVLTDILDSVIEYATPETVEKDMQAVQSVIDVISKGEDLELTEEKSKEIIESIGQSDSIMSMIDSVTKDETKTSLEDLVSNVGTENLNKLNETVNNSDVLTEDQKSILNSLFGNLN